MSIRRILLTMMMLALTAGSLAACNTISGAGEDISAGGDAISDTADDVKDEM
ncbi:entericidin A/B family lipoprotein [Geminicoccus harenae]|uniref:entericidin A/B family lipoprotein n=1 Tax=Geminicoccus harenae TaxID=2498453 RepID=UPI00168A64DA|nr:entericidin A/B family lipoprotein [Geminicoccus harenae]